jgi:DnaJ-class molecular chaperone
VDKDQRRDKYLVRTRNKQPDLVRKAGPHIKATRYEPDVCSACSGTGIVPQVCFDDQFAECATCEGSGEV